MSTSISIGIMIWQLSMVFQLGLPGKKSQEPHVRFKVARISKAARKGRHFRGKLWAFNGFNASLAMGLYGLFTDFPIGIWFLLPLVVGLIYKTIRKIWIRSVLRREAREMAQWQTQRPHR